MKNKVFRNALHGYNRDDVNMYITEQNGNFAEQEAEYKKTIADLREAMGKLQEKAELYDGLAEKMAQAEGLLAAQGELAEKANTVAEEQSERIRRLNAENEELRSRLEEAQRRADTLAAQQSAPSDGEADTGHYDEMCSRLGELMVTARADADAMLKKAQEERDDILRSAQKEADEIVRVAQTYADGVAREADARRKTASDFIHMTVKKATKECLGEYSGRMKELKENLDRMLTEAQSASDHAAEKTDSILQSAEREFDANFGVN